VAIGCAVPEQTIEIPIERLTSMWGRLRGLIGRPAPAPGQAVWLSPCRQVHTWAMGYAIDVVHVDKNWRVLSVQTLEPWRFGRWRLAARGVLELRAGEAARLGIVYERTVCLIEGNTSC